MDHTDYGYEKNRYISTGRALENTYNGSLKVLISEKSKVDNYGQTLEERINRIDAIKYFLIKLNVSITNRIEIAKNDANLLNYENKNFTQADLERTFGEIDEHIENYANNSYEIDAFLDTLKEKLKRDLIRLKGEKLKSLLKSEQTKKDIDFSSKIEAAIRSNFNESVAADTRYKKCKNEFIQKRDYAKNHNKKFITSINNSFDIENNIVSREFIESAINTGDSMLLNPRKYPSRSNFISKLDIDLGNGTVIWIGDSGALITEEQSVLNEQNEVIGFRVKVKSFDFMDGIARESENGYFKTDKEQIGFKAIRKTDEEKSIIPTCFIKRNQKGKNIEQNSSEPSQENFKSYIDYYKFLDKENIKFVSAPILNKDWRKYSNDFLKKEAEIVGVTLTPAELDARANSYEIIK